MLVNSHISGLCVLNRKHSAVSEGQALNATRKWNGWCALTVLHLHEQCVCKPKTPTVSIRSESTFTSNIAPNKNRTTLHPHPPPPSYFRCLFHYTGLWMWHDVLVTGTFYFRLGIENIGNMDFTEARRVRKWNCTAASFRACETTTVMANQHFCLYQTLKLDDRHG